MIAIECGNNVKIQAMRERLFRAVRILCWCLWWCACPSTFVCLPSFSCSHYRYYWWHCMLTRSIVSTKRFITSRPLHCLRSRQPYFTDLGGTCTTTKIPGTRTKNCWSYPGILGSSLESQTCCCLSAAFFSQALYKQAAPQHADLFH